MSSLGFGWFENLEMDLFFTKSWASFLTFFPELESFSKEFFLGWEGESKLGLEKQSGLMTLESLEGRKRGP